MRASPQTDRVVAILNLLSVDPARGYSLTELAARLNVHKATLYPMLSALVRAGFLVRAECEKLFRLGPSIIAIGEAAARPLSMLDAARRAVAELHAHLNLPCYASAIADGSLTVIEVADVGTVIEGTARRGQRHSLIYPAGIGVVSWLDAATQADWIARAWPQYDEDALLRSMALIRERGYAVERRAGSVPDVAAFLRTFATHPLPDDERNLLTRLERAVTMRSGFIVDELETNESYGVLTLDAPVFDRAGVLEMRITVVMADPPNSGHHVARVGATLSEFARHTSEQIGGRPQRFA